MRTLPLYAIDESQLRTMLSLRFVLPVIRHAILNEPAASGAIFAVGRVLDEHGVERVALRFVLTEEEAPSWPFASSPKHNALLADGRSQRAIDAALRTLFGDNDLRFEPESLLRCTLGPYCRDPRPEGEALSTAFAPYLRISKYQREGDWYRQFPFALKTEQLGVVLSPDLIWTPAEPDSDDPRDRIHPMILLDTLNSRGDVTWLVQETPAALDLIERYIADPADAGLRAQVEQLQKRLLKRSLF